ncbi:MULTISPECIES: hypothetical protein [Bacillales]|uniref:hypothetical protein n=1 Tax=Bacillales TaxID=1385 RepID=UPI00096E2C57|nr:hypothetical protein [Paenibacillus sp. FSL R5-0490]OMF60301.1 hypothetical protein BK139_10190 [Paenibacillus sp. FSL R5-0490]
MNSKIKECMLSPEQRYLILQGIKNSKEAFRESTQSIPNTVTKKHTPHLLSDLINEHVLRMIEQNPHTQMKVYPKIAGFHPYIAIHDTVRNIFILLSKLPKSKYIMSPSGYRKEFSSANLNRLLDMGVPQDELLKDVPVYQGSLFLGEANQPFGIIVCYDSKSDIVFEGALRPDQEDWIFKEDITDDINLTTGSLFGLNSHNLEDIKVTLKTTTADDEIVLKLKNSTSS